MYFKKTNIYLQKQKYLQLQPVFTYTGSLCHGMTSIDLLELKTAMDLLHDID